MADRTRIFICYKKRGSDGRESNSAYQLYQFLSEIPDYEVWMDEGLDAGLLWEKTIYENLLSSDALILAVGEGTSQSEWVRRELSMAMSFGIQIIPVGLNITEAKLHSELEALGLTGIHYKRPFNIASQTARAIAIELAPAIERAKDNTRRSGHELLKKISDRIKPIAQAAKPVLSAASRQFAVRSKQITIHIASGDIFRLSNYDLLVNSENDYMQMARIFDMASLSASIRHYGSAVERGYLEDTIQLEIEKMFGGRPRPVPPASSVITSSGGPSSALYRNNRVTHIIHVAAVQAILAEHRIAPLMAESQIRDCVSSALLAVQNVCACNGVVSPEGSPQRHLQEATADRFNPKRVVLPLFGTGRGGRRASDVGTIVLEAILDFFNGPLHDDVNMLVTDIHVSVFSEDDVATMSSALGRLGN